MSRGGWIFAHGACILVAFAPGVRAGTGNSKYLVIMRQFITPERRIFTSGEVATFVLDPEMSELPPGRAVLRTNLGRAAVRREELLKKSNESAHKTRLRDGRA